jgi:hypothetical protein
MRGGGSGGRIVGVDARPILAGVQHERELTVEQALRDGDGASVGAVMQAAAVPAARPRE